MRAHFAGDVADSVDTIEAEPLEARMDNFKRDSKNMEALSEFIDDVLQKAEVEVTKQQNDKNSQQSKEKSRQSFSIPDFKNGKVVNRARGLVVRLFDAICNCANTAAGPAQRLKLRGKRSASNAGNNAASIDDDAAKVEIKDKSKKLEDAKEEKSNKKDDKEKDERAENNDKESQQNGLKE